MEKLHFFSLESLQQFASENKIFNTHFVAPLCEYDRQKYSVLEVEDFSELAPFYEVRPMDDERYADTYYVESHYWVLRIIPTGEVFRIIEPARGKFSLCMFDRTRLGRDTYFRFDEVERPNYIGKATQKKLSAWIDYLHLEHTARCNYVNSALCRNIAFVDRFKAKTFDFARYYTGADGWTSEFIIEWDRFTIKYTAHENGYFSRQVSLKYLCTPTDEEILA